MILSGESSATGNYRVPKTGDEAPVWLWLGCVAAGLMVMTFALRSGKRKKAHAR